MSAPEFATAIDAEAAFYEAFRSLSEVDMRKVWCDSPEVFCIHPGGPVLSGHDAVLASWRRIFAGAERPHLEHRLLHAHRGESIATHLVEERIAGGTGESRQLAVVLASNLYRADARGWRLFGHHASLVPPQAAAVTREPSIH